MIKLGLRDAAVDAALRPFADEVLALLIELLAAYKESGDAELLATLDDHRRELAAAVDPEALPALAGSCLETARAAVVRARERQAEQHAELARFVALVRDTVTVLGGEGDDPSKEITSAADRFSELLEISDVSQLKARIDAGGLTPAKAGRRTPASVAPRHRQLHGRAWPRSNVSSPASAKRPRSIR